MTDNYDLQAVRELLSAALSSGEISTLAFDLFPTVYEDFTAGMTRSQKIEMIVSHASRKGRVHDLIGYIERYNPYQHGRFANRLLSHPSSGPNYRAQRLQDIEQHIESERQLLNKYEEQLRYADDPRQMLRIEKEIERQKTALAEYQREADELSVTAGQSRPAAAATVQQSLTAMSQQLDALSGQLQQAEARLAGGQEALRADLAQQQAAILAHIDGRHAETVATVLQRLDADQLEVVELLLDAADRQQIAQWEGEQLTLLTQQVLVELHHARQGRPDADQWQSILSILERDSGWEQKLKLTLPLIPGLLSFESEAKVEVMDVLKESWQRLLTKVK